MLKFAADYAIVLFEIPDPRRPLNALKRSQVTGMGLIRYEMGALASSSKVTISQASG